MKGINRRQVLLSASAMVGAPYAARADAPDTVRFGVLHPNLTTVIHEIAKRTGAYERQNLKVVETKFKSGQTVEGVEQLWRGNLDFYMGGAPEVPRLNSRLIESSNMVPALLTGQIDGFLHSEPTTTLAIVNKAGHLFMQAARGDMGPNPPPATLMSSRR